MIQSLIDDIISSMTILLLRKVKLGMLLSKAVLRILVLFGFKSKKKYIAENKKSEKEF